MYVHRRKHTRASWSMSTRAEMVLSSCMCVPGECKAHGCAVSEALEWGQGRAGPRHAPVVSSVGISDAVLPPATSRPQGGGSWAVLLIAIAGVGVCTHAAAPSGKRKWIKTVLRWQRPECLSAPSVAAGPCTTRWWTCTWARRPPCPSTSRRGSARHSRGCSR